MTAIDDLTASWNLRGRAAVVTGSSSGIGRAILLRLAAAGADCLVHAGRNRGGAEAVAAEASAAGVGTQVVVADLATSAGRTELLEKARDWRGEFDIWVNNAGVDVLTGEAADWPFARKLAALWEVDVEATIELARAVGARMKQVGRGVILNMGWDQAGQGMAGDSAEMFAATKGAVMAFTKCLAQSLAPEVRVNCVAPGWIRTSWGEEASEYWQKRAEQESLVGRWGTPEDVAAMAHFLCCDAASFITGQVVPVNGGFRAR
ncbi:MAG: SDR family NAD(P)-dependent oxidoreductase [Planctomycetota bacterium]|nr:MAG: SDR family NAD(P)-dependent oxidoreductase [Planctomycetota bacterium]REJ93979.1 MAG: SDR family NAD(P)-dependent oxidoreductase [Planctomycetota bacterium]REK30959.1 MAG: SDR family NAD(P)-dependent oxidoreductase [Planctomycetota bacterium]REK38211.1 MAG: SDR family NAD(P)-dependent oxidoreductase [Planctomycetota bacterium]